MRRIRYVVATSADGYIAGPKGEADWIIIDPEIDFNAIFAEFDTVFVGRRTFDSMTQGHSSDLFGMKTYVFSTTMRQSDHPKVTVVSDNIDKTISAVRAEPGKDIWLFGGGLLFRSLLEAGHVDAVEVAVIPVVLGGGIPLLPAPATHSKLELTTHKLYAKTGTVSLSYSIVRPANRKVR